MELMKEKLFWYLAILRSLCSSKQGLTPGMPKQSQQDTAYPSPAEGEVPVSVSEPRLSPGAYPVVLQV